MAKVPNYLRELSKAIGVAKPIIVANTHTLKALSEILFPFKISGIYNQITGPNETPNVKVKRMTIYF
jgi:hypothetical protein